MREVKNGSLYANRPGKLGRREAGVQPSSRMPISEELVSAGDPIFEKIEMFMVGGMGV